MKHCPNRDCTHLRRFDRIAEYREAATSCSDCDGVLALGPPPEPEPEAFRELVTIYVAPDSVRAHLLKSLLTDLGMTAVVIGDALGAAVGELPATVLNVRVQVPPESAAEAAQLARDFDRGELGH